MRKTSTAHDCVPTNLFTSQILIKKTKRLNSFVAFTLSELLMSVLVISIIMVAMAPVITKRVSDNISVADVRYEGRLFTASTTSLDGCTQDVDSNQNVCTFTVPENVYSVGVVAVAGGGAGGKAGSLSGIKEVPEGASSSGAFTNFTDYQHHFIRIPITPDKMEYKFNMRAESGVGGGGAYVNKGTAPTKEDCDKYGAFFFDSNGDGYGTCITKKNVGDITGLGTAELASAGVTVLSSGETCTTLGNCCWKGGRTSGSCTSSGTWGENSTTYSGCYRTVCHPIAAQKACENYVPVGDVSEETKGKWRLPTQSELNSWDIAMNHDIDSTSAVFSKYLGDNGLNFCDGGSSSYGSLYCGGYDDMCPNADDSAYLSDCSPNYLAGQLATSGSAVEYNYYAGSYLSMGNFNLSSSNFYDQAMSARCVFDNYGSDKYTINVGGQGNGGGFLKGYIPELAIAEAMGGEIVLHFPANIKRSDLSLNGTSSGADGLKYSGFSLPKTGSMYTYVYFGDTVVDYKFHSDIVYIAAYRKAGCPNISGCTPTFFAALPRGASGEPAKKSGDRMYHGVANLTNADAQDCYLYLGVDEGETRDPVFCTNGYTDYTYPVIGASGETLELDLYSERTDYTDFLDDGTKITEQAISPASVLGVNSQGSMSSKGGSFRLEENETTGNMDFISVQPEVGRRLRVFSLTYKRICHASGGFGGGGGGAFRINDVRVNPQDTITIKVGKGGVNLCMDSIDPEGGTSGFEHVSNGVTQSLYVSGGLSGWDGVESKPTGSNQVIYSSVEEANTVANTRVAARGGKIFTGTLVDRAEKLEGEDGEKVGTRTIVLNGTNVVDSTGGNGGKSGIGSIGGCGALSVGTDCYSNSTSRWDDVYDSWSDGYTQQFRKEYKLANGKTAQFQVSEADIMNRNYGQAGSGGGGGGISTRLQTSTCGGDGTDGYVYVYWARVD